MFLNITCRKGIVTKNNYIGTGTVGTEALGNSLDGIYLTGACSNNIIGAAGDGNIIVGNRYGIWMDTVTGSDNSIKGNNVGIDVTGAGDLGNLDTGIYVSGTGTIVGGVGAGDENLISGNAGHGIYISGGSGSIIKGNIIGTNADGTAAITNGGSGIHIDGGSTATIGGSIAAGAGNLISGNTQRGIFINSTAGDGHIIQGNIVGLDIDKTACIANTWSGIEVYTNDNTIGGDTSDYRNWSSCNNYGVVLGGDRNIVKNNYLGTGVLGTEDFGNTADGIYMQVADSDDNVIGAVGDGNLIVFNDGSGISITGGATSEDNIIQGNYVGLALDGTTDQGNTVHGIYTNATGTIIGGIVNGEENFISGNGQRGIFIDGAGTIVKGNIIGTNAAGTGAVANASEGVFIQSNNNTIGGTTAADRNIISGNTLTGVYIIQAIEGVAVENNVVEGNYIGVAANGTSDLGNGGQGVHIIGTLTQNNTIGGTTTSAKNIISGNVGFGVWLLNAGTGNVVAGNYIGTNAAGTGAVPNDIYGISLDNSSGNTIGGTTVGSRNVISGNAASGIFIVNAANTNIIENNYIGVDSTGNVDLGNGDEGADSGIYVTGSSSGNFIGTAGYGNVVSGNFYRGIFIVDAGSTNNSIQANIVGLGADGSTAIGNGDGGIVMVTTTGTIIGTANTPSARNIVSSNGSHGIWMFDADTSTVVNNYVGVASDGSTSRTNVGDGIRIENTSASNVIGGTATGAGNTIKASGTNSCTIIVADAGHYNNIRHNSCLNESATELNIERLGSANEGAATPVILAATTSRVNGTTIFDAGIVDIFVDGVYTASTTAVAGVWSKDVAISGTNVSASVTNATNSTSSTTAFTAIVADSSNPTVSTLSPTDGATSVSTTANLVLTFSEAVNAVSGNIVIKKTYNNATVETIAVTDGTKVSGSGTATITINPSTTLGSLVGYYVQIDATAFDDLSGNSYAGISNTTSWNFTTAGTAGFTTSAISANTTETGGTAQFTVRLTTEPTATVTIPLSSSDTTEGTISPDTLTFTSVNWASDQTVTVTGINDDVDDGNIIYSGVLGTTTSDNSNYNNVNPADVSITNTDDDVTGVTISAITGNTTEAGGTATFTVRLNSEPTSSVTIPLFSSDTTEGTISPDSLTFNNADWGTNKTITVTGGSDSIVDGDITYSVLLISINSTDPTYSNVNPDDVSVTNTDDDTVGFTISSISGNTTEAGGTATFTVKLNSEPTADVTIAVSSSDTTEGTVSPSSLTFTNTDWGNKTVMVTGVNDTVIDGDVAYSAILGTSTSSDNNYNSINPSDVSITNTDNDTAGFTISAISGNTTEAAGTATFTVKLNIAPTATVVIPVSSSDTTEGTVSPSSLTFTTVNWGTNQTVTVTGVDDSVDDGDAVYSTVLGTITSDDSSYNALNPDDVSVTNTDDNDTTSVTTTVSSTTGGGSGGSSGNTGTGGNHATTTTHTDDTDTEVVDNTNDEISDTNSENQNDENNEETDNTENTLGFTTPDHWAGNYLENLTQDNHVVETALQEPTFLSVLTEMFTQPDKGINRGETLEFLVVLSGIDSETIQIESGNSPFTDVSADYPRGKYIEFAFKENLVSGYPDGSFKPDQTINRAEALKMTLQFFGYSLNTSLRGTELLNTYNLSENPFSDVDLNAWYAPYVMFEYAHGVISGYGDGSFGPGNTVTYAELLKIATLTQNI